MAEKFFEERKEQSEAKARIVSKYFTAWANVVMSTAQRAGGKIAYVDLYAGPGRYRDGAMSTPLLVLQSAINHPRISQMLVSFFNDSDPNKIATLKREISKLPGIGNLAYQPVVRCGEVDAEAENYFGQTRLVPTFSFIDPFGYKGLSLKIIRGVIKDWGCDCVFFFNYSRINAGISNPYVEEHINALFSKARANKLRQMLVGQDPIFREAAILEELANEIKELGGQFVLPFTFKSTLGTRTSHKLIFVSKNFKGYEIMKDIMAKESSTQDEGVSSFTYSPADRATPLLFSLAQPMSELRESLLKSFAGRMLTFNQLYREHSVDRPYTSKNYREALKQLEDEGRILARSPNKIRRQFTYAEHVQIKFPEGQSHG